MTAAPRRWAAELLHFWFHHMRASQWFGRDDALDATLRRRFGRELAALSRQSPRSFLRDRETARAAVLLFDQLPRNLHRDSARAFANDPVNLKASWEKAKVVMGPGTALDPLMKELIYITVSIMNNCEYCIHTHTHFAKNKGMTQDQYNDMLRVIRNHRRAARCARDRGRPCCWG